MKTAFCAAAAAVLLGAVGCGESDNSKVQTPNDQPILQPGGLKGGGRGGGDGATPPVQKGGGRSAPVGGQKLK